MRKNVFIVLSFATSIFYTLQSAKVEAKNLKFVSAETNSSTDTSTDLENNPKIKKLKKHPRWDLEYMLLKYLKKDGVVTQTEFETWQNEAKQEWQEAFPNIPNLPPYLLISWTDVVTKYGKNNQLTKTQVKAWMRDLYGPMKIYMKEYFSHDEKECKKNLSEIKNHPRWNLEYMLFKYLKKDGVVTETEFHTWQTESTQEWKESFPYITTLPPYLTAKWTDVVSKYGKNNRLTKDQVKDWMHDLYSAMDAYMQQNFPQDLDCNKNSESGTDAQTDTGVN